MKKLLNKLYLPFEKVEFFILILILTTGIDFVYSIYKTDYKFAIYLFFHGYVLSYILCLFTNALPRKLQALVKIFSTTVFSLFFIADLFSVTIYHERFNEEFATIIMQTNMSEAYEFIKTYLSYTTIILFLIVIILISTLYLKAKKLRCSTVLLPSCLFIVPIGIMLTIHNPQIYKEAFIGKIISTIQIPTNIIDLRDYLSNPQIILKKNKKPANIIMLFGESFSKKHSSLYAYEKITNPLLSTLTKDSLLYVYKNIESPGLGTFASFKCFMSTYSPKYNNIDWYKCTTIPEIVKKAGYHTIWISNQSKIGLFDTAVGRYADLCDKQHFTGDKFAGMRRHNQYDEMILNILPTLYKDTTTHQFHFIQLMGSHFDFKDRYPNNFEKYLPDDYINYPSHQRNTLAAYDNSILYNDFVVYSIMNFYKNKEAILFYFSDHALDIFDSSDDYVGHARGTDSLSVIAGKRIPFMIYASPVFQKNYPNEMILIKKSINNDFNTDNMIYTIMDIIGIESDNISPKKYSLFQM